MDEWRGLIPDGVKELYHSGGLGISQTLGCECALLVIDCTLGFLGGEECHSVEEAMAKDELACGPQGWQALACIQEVIENFRRHDQPILYTRRDVQTQRRIGGATKRLVKRREDRNKNEFPEMISPEPKDIILEKARASAFFGTPLEMYLNNLDVDSVVLVGTSTSGCVRATAIDAFSYGYKVFLVEEGCFDRSEFINAVSLFDIDAKYATVVTRDDVRKALDVKIE